MIKVEKNVEKLNQKKNQEKKLKIFILDWLIEDKDDKIEVKGYGVDESNQHILLHFEYLSFRPWLTIEITDEQDFSEGLLLFQLKKVFHNAMLIDTVNESNLKDLPAIVAHKTMMDKKLYFASTKKKKIYKIRFTSIKHRSMFYYIFRKKSKLQKFNFKIHELEATPFLQMLCSFNLPSTGWIEIDQYHDNVISFTRKSREIKCQPKDVKTSKDQEKIPSLRTLSFDIECYSSIHTRMPNALEEKDCVFQIGVSVRDENNKDADILFTLSKKKFILKNITIYCFQNEKKLLQAFIDFIIEWNPSIMIGYNIFNFDIPFLNTRCIRYGIDMSIIGMAKNRKAEYIEKEWKSSAYSCQIFKFFDLDGRIWVDLLPIIKRDFKLPNYKLATVTSKFIGETKDPLTVKDIFLAYSSGFLQNKTPLIVKCGHYCVKDAQITLKLYFKLQTLISLIEMARLTNTHILDLYTKGQQIKVFNQIYRTCYEENRMVDSFDQLEEEERQEIIINKFTGAYVFPPSPGIYDMVVSFDFSSLYPSVIIAFNICYSTFVSEKQNIGDDKCHIIEWTEDKEHFKYRFLKSPIGVLPGILLSLLDRRAKTKSMMKKETNPFKKEVYNKRQLALKISANSAYGALGVTKGYLPFKIGAMATTSKGRESIQRAADYVKNKFDANIIYGDSVSGDSCIFIKQEDSIKIFAIEKFFMNFQNSILPYQQFKRFDNACSRKEQIIFNSSKFSIYTHNKWSFIKRVIRHKAAKQLYKVYSSAGSIVCTEDHSLLLKRLTVDDDVDDDVNDNERQTNNNATSYFQIKPQDLVSNEHELLCIEESELQKIAHAIIYQKEEWQSLYTQIGSKVFFDSDCENKYISYIYYTYLQQFPKAVFDFTIKNGRKQYIIDLENERNLSPGLVLLVEKIESNEDDYVYDIETNEGSFHTSTGHLIVKNTDSIYVNFDNYTNPKQIWNYSKHIEKHLMDIQFFPSAMKLLFEECIYKRFFILTKKRYIGLAIDHTTGKIDDDLSFKGVVLTRRDNSEFVRSIYSEIVRKIMDGEQFEKVYQYINSEFLKLFQWHREMIDVNKFVITKSLNDSYKIKEISSDYKKAVKRFNDLDLNLSDYSSLGKKVTSQNFHSFVDKFNQDIEMGKSSIPLIQDYIDLSLPSHAQLANRMRLRGNPITPGSRMEFVICNHIDDPDKSKLCQKIEDPDVFCNIADIVRIDKLFYCKSTVQCFDQLLTTAFSKKNPVKNLYSFHYDHAKVMKELKNNNKTKILLQK